MHNKNIILASILFIVIIIGMFAFAYLKRSEMQATTPLDTGAGEVDSVLSYPGVERIDAKHFYRDETHIFVGEIALPTPCDLLETSVGSVAESLPEQVTLQFDVINNSESCIQQVTTQRFRIDVPGVSEDAVFTARFLDRVVEFNPIPGSDDEDPDDFELFIKG